MLMISQSALTSRHRPYPCLAQNFRREAQLSSRVPSKTFEFIVFRSRAEGIPVISNSIQTQRPPCHGISNENHPRSRLRPRVSSRLGMPIDVQRPVPYLLMTY